MNNQIVKKLKDRDVLQEILAWLNMEKLLEVQLVCKKWYTSTVPLTIQNFKLNLFEIDYRKHWPNITKEEALKAQ